tara:strand:+ start:76 stop:363 length:288 start_codon:yes stop_codon:yes gene_type:complete
MNAENSVVGYLKFKKIQDLGFLKYGHYKRIISYVLDCFNDYYIRKLFLSLIDKGYFIKRKNLKKSYNYEFNPNGSDVSTPIKIIHDASYFTIYWE